MIMRHSVLIFPLPGAKPLFHEESDLPAEERTARLTILVDPRKKAVFEKLCAEEDATPSQVMRRLMRRYIEERTGQPWSRSPAAVDVPRASIKKSERGAGQKIGK
jgi:hypothetical protein